MLRKILLAAFAVMLFTPAFGQIQVFVTSQQTDGLIGGQTGGDSFCNNAAQAAALPGTWTAWLGPGSCGTCQDAVDRIMDGQYQLLDGTIVANSKADLTDGTLVNAISMDETGSTQQGTNNVWTGVDPDGHSTSGPGTCTNWNNNGTGSNGSAGSSSSTDSAWTDFNVGGGVNCDTPLRLFCFANQMVPVEMEEAEVK